MTPSANTSFTGQTVMSGCFRETSENMRDEVSRKLESIEQAIQFWWDALQPTNFV